MQPYLVLVEGSDDQAIVAGLIRFESIEGFHIHNMIGKDEWTRKLRGICRSRGFGRVHGLGLVRDADSDGASQFQSCRTSLEVAKLPVPTATSVLEAGRPAVAIFIVPETTRVGAIEEVCLPSFDAARMGCVDGYFSCLPGAVATKPKASVQTYLAGLQPSCRDLKVAVREGLIDFSHATFDGLREFLHELRSA
jgi:hypothetical protein